jgi:hypothetical protein
MVVLRNRTENGEVIEATFLPEGGMNLASFRMGDIEAIDQHTKGLYEERFAGLGALIGPHFHKRADKDVTGGFDESLFPHIAHEKKKGVKEPFTHGIARYVPWKYEASETQIIGSLSGDDKYKGVPLKVFEGMDFSMHFSAALVHDGLLINYRIKSERPSMIGFHYYYAMQGQCAVEAHVEDQYRDVEEWKKIPADWMKGDRLHFDLNQVSDFGFRPKQSPNEPFNRILLRGESHLLHVDYCGNYDDQTSWQLWHPKDETFVCIEPLTALNPRKPEFTETNLELKLSIYA